MYLLRDKTYQKVTPWFRDEVRDFVACSEIFEVGGKLKGELEVALFTRQG
jgi:hypothetical protein